MYIELSATVAAIIERDKHFLMIQEHSHGKLVYNQPAGHVEKNEDFIEAVIRETFEETAWRFNPTEIVGIYQWTNPDNQATFLRVCFTGTCHDREPQTPLDEGIVQACWMTLDEINDNYSQLRSPLVLAGINDYLEGKRYPLDLLKTIHQDSTIAV